MTQKLTANRDDIEADAIDPSARAIPDPCPACGSRTAQSIARRTYRNRTWTLARCDECRQHFTSPIPSCTDITSFYAGDYHAPLRETDGTERAFGTKYDRYVRTLARFLPSGRVLDIGCATGLLVKRLVDRCYRAQGVELNQRSAEYGRRTFGIDIRNEPLESCDFADGWFDAAFMTDVLEHTPHPGAFLREVGRILRVGGYAVVTFPDICSIESRYLYALSKLIRRDWIWNTCHIPLHTWEFTRATATAMFEAAGFDVVAFRRSQPPIETQPSVMLAALRAPIRLLSIPMIDRFFGTQLEFVIRKSVDGGRV